LASDLRRARRYARRCSLPNPPVGFGPESGVRLGAAATGLGDLKPAGGIEALGIDLVLADDCVFHTKLDTDSTGNWTLIPCQTGQGFQGNLDT